MENKNTKGPIAPKIPKELSIHGDTRLDNYYWLNERENPAVIDYLNAENDFQSAEMQHTEPLQQKLFEEIKGRIKEEDQSVPYKKNGYWYSIRFEKGDQYPIYFRQKGNLNAPEEIILNVNELAEGHDYYKAAGLSISPDNKWLSFGEDTLSRRIYTIRFKNLETGEILNSTIPNTTGSATWAADSETVFYSVRDETALPARFPTNIATSKPINLLENSRFLTPAKRT
jgi:oligopeptidase B